MRCSLAAVALVVIGSAGAYAGVSREQAARLGVDVVQLQGGREVRGSIVERSDDGELSIAVRRAWLKEEQPEWAAELEAAAEAGRRAALETLVERTRDWLAARSEDKRLSAVLQIELERLERRLAKDAPQPDGASASEFVLVTIPGDEIRREYAQPAQRKQLALVAWQAGIDRVEATSVQRLRDELERRKVNWRETVVNLSERLSSTAADSEREWAARRAIYEFSYRKPMEFQGAGNFLVQTGEGADAPAGLDLVSGLVKGNAPADLTELLQGALGEGVKAKGRQNWLESATRAAERAGVEGFRVIRTDQDVRKKTVTVEDRFVARMPDGGWETVWQTKVAGDASKPRGELEDRIREDKQVADVLKLAEGLGLGGGVDTAVRFGAATMEAQAEAAGRYFEFIDRYTLQLDGPVLKWSADQN